MSRRPVDPNLEGNVLSILRKANAPLTITSLFVELGLACSDNADRDRTYRRIHNVLEKHINSGQVARVPNPEGDYRTIHAYQLQR